MQWINYVIPENGLLYQELSSGTSTFGVSQLPRAVLSPFETERAKLEQLMAETRDVLSRYVLCVHNPCAYDDFFIANLMNCSLLPSLTPMYKKFILHGNTKSV